MSDNRDTGRLPLAAVAARQNPPFARECACVRARARALATAASRTRPPTCPSHAPLPSEARSAEPTKGLAGRTRAMVCRWRGGVKEETDEGSFAPTRRRVVDGCDGPLGPWSERAHAKFSTSEALCPIAKLVDRIEWLGNPENYVGDGGWHLQDSFGNFPSKNLEVQISTPERLERQLEPGGKRTSELQPECFKDDEMVTLSPVCVVTLRVAGRREW